MKGWKKILHASGNQKRAGVAILMSDKTDFNSKPVARDSLKANDKGIISPRE